MRKEKPKKIKR